MPTLSIFAFMVIATMNSATPSNDVFLVYRSGTTYAGGWKPCIGVTCSYYVVHEPSGINLASGELVPSYDSVVANTQDAAGNWHTFGYTPYEGFGAFRADFLALGDLLPYVDLTNTKVHVGDFNGDGASDLLVARADANGNWHNDVYLKTGKVFSYAGDWLPGKGRNANYRIVHRGALADAWTGGWFWWDNLLINYQDAAGNWHTDEYVSYWATGYFDTHFTLAGTVLPGVDLTNSYVGDFTGDGQSELLVARADALGVWHNYVYFGYGNAVDCLPNVGRNGNYHLVRRGVIEDPWNGQMVWRDHVLINSQDAAGVWHANEYSLCVPYGTPGATNGTDILPNTFLGTAYVGEFNGDGQSDLLVRTAPPPDEKYVPGYIVNSIKYALPGNKSSVKYESGSSIGSTFETNTVLSDKYTVGWDSSLLGVVSGTEWNIGQKSSKKLVMQSSANGTVTDKSDADVADHLQDTFTLWINPLLTRHQLYDLATGKLAPDQYFFGAMYELWVPNGLFGDSPVVMNFTVAEMVNPLIIADLYKRLFLSQLDWTDIQAILSLDPFILPDGTVNQNPSLGAGVNRDRFRPVQPGSTGGCGVAFAGVSASHIVDCVAKYSYSSENVSTFNANWKVTLGLKVLGGRAANEFSVSYSRSETNTSGMSTAATVHLETSTPNMCIDGQLLTDTMFNTFIVPSYTHNCI